MLPDFKKYSKTTVPKRVWYQGRVGHAKQQDGREGPELDARVNGQLIFDKGAKAIRSRKNSLSSEWSWSNWTGLCRGRARTPNPAPEGRDRPREENAC